MKSKWCNDTVTGQQALYYWKNLLKNDVIKQLLYQEPGFYIGGGQNQKIKQAATVAQSYYTYSHLLFPKESSA